MKKQTVGIVAHVDAGKTTCIEAMLYQSGAIRKLGRVDHRDTVMDYDAEERAHGITIYAKEAHFDYKDTRFYLIDTPGHADFSSEMERSLAILDLAVVVINGQDGVQSHTETIWKCLAHYHIPVLVFINKMDISFLSKEQLIKDLQTKCSDACIAFQEADTEEEASLCDDAMLEEYTETGHLSEEAMRCAFYQRKIFPVLFGSALKMDGIDALLDLLVQMAPERIYPEAFGAKVYKISMDEQGERLAHLKITGGRIAVKEKIGETEKIDAIRMYQGAQYDACKEAEAGDVIAVKGLNSAEAGDGLGFEEKTGHPLLQACMTYELVNDEHANALALAETMKQLAAEDPQLQVSIDEKSQKIQVQIMGEMQKEVLQKKILESSGITVGFGTGEILYQETIASAADGAGHFEPLRHYAEVHLHLEPLPAGSGIVIDTACSSDELNASWQRSILSSLQRKRHLGVLSGSPLTDVRITLIAGKGSIKHTSGGDFRQASLRAVRQALMKADSVLLEPYDSFVLSVPAAFLSRALFDLQQRHADVKVSEQENGWMNISGRGPVRMMVNYQNEVIAYTKGSGRYTSSFEGYHPCMDAASIIAEIGYDPQMDLKNPADSVFCANGTGYNAGWAEADAQMDIPLKKESSASYHTETVKVAEEDLHAILQSASSNNRNASKEMHSAVQKDEKESRKRAAPHLPSLLIIDGYNMIYDWPETKDLVKEDLYAARNTLLAILQNYQAYTKDAMIVVFDGYLKKDNPGSVIKKKDLTIVYTKTDETADAWIESAGYRYRGIYALSVATSDGLIQNAVFSQGALRISAREMHERIAFADRQIKEKSEHL
jgi:small GTP-binding protein